MHALIRAKCRNTVNSIFFLPVKGKKTPQNNKESQWKHLVRVKLLQSTDKYSLILSEGSTSDAHPSFRETKFFQTSSSNVKEKWSSESNEIFSEKPDLEKEKNSKYSFSKSQSRSTEKSSY